MRSACGDGSEAAEASAKAAEAMAAELLEARAKVAQTTAQAAAQSFASQTNFAAEAGAKALQCRKAAAQPASGQPGSKRRRRRRLEKPLPNECVPLGVWHSLLLCLLPQLIDTASRQTWTRRAVRLGGAQYALSMHAGPARACDMHVCSEAHRTLRKRGWEHMESLTPMQTVWNST